MNVQGMYVTCI